MGSFYLTKFLPLIFLLLLAGKVCAEVEARLVGEDGSPVKVADQHLVVGKFDFNIGSHAFLTAINTAQNFWPPKTGKRFIIDCLIISGDKNVTANDNANVIVYEATSTVSRTQSGVVYKDAFERQARFNQCGLNFEIPEGFYVNAETDDNNISVNIIGYFIPIE